MSLGKILISHLKIFLSPIFLVLNPTTFVPYIEYFFLIPAVPDLNQYLPFLHLALSVSALSNFLLINLPFLIPFLPAQQRKSHLCITFLGIPRPHVSMSDLYISRIVPHIFLQQNRQPDPGNK